jgi:hypothetical protein
MQMQQLVTCARRAATGALPSGYQSEWTFGKPLIRRAGGVEEEEKNCDCRQSHPDDRGNCTLPGFIDRDGDVVRRARIGGRLIRTTLCVRKYTSAQILHLTLSGR